MSTAPAPRTDGVALVALAVVVLLLVIPTGGEIPVLLTLPSGLVAGVGLLVLG